MLNTKKFSFWTQHFVSCWCLILQSFKKPIMNVQPASVWDQNNSKLLNRGIHSTETAKSDKWFEFWLLCLLKLGQHKIAQCPISFAKKEQCSTNVQHALEFCEHSRFAKQNSNHPSFPVKSLQQHFYVRWLSDVACKPPVPSWIVASVGKHTYTST